MRPFYRRFLRTCSLRVLFCVVRGVHSDGHSSAARRPTPFRMRNTPAELAEAVSTACAALEREFLALSALLSRNSDPFAEEVPYELLHEKYNTCKELLRRLRSMLFEQISESGTLYQHMQYLWLAEQQPEATGSAALVAQRSRLEQVLRGFRYVTGGAKPLASHNVQEGWDASGTVEVHSSRLSAAVAGSRAANAQG